MGTLAGIVLCGGKSSRMGTAKAWLDVGGETLLARTVRVVASVTSRVVVVASPGQDLPLLPEGVVVVRDRVVDKGPLAGILEGLDAIAPHASAAFVATTDAPFLRAALVRRLDALREADDDAVAIRVRDRVHPLPAIFTLSARPEIAASLAAGKLKLSTLLERVRTRYVDEALLLADPELARDDPALRSLRNVNTPAEYAAAIAELATFALPSRP